MVEEIILNEEYLQRAIDKSIDSAGLKHYLGIFTDETGKTDWGAFYGLKENCCVSIGIENCDPEKISKMLNAYKIPAVSINEQCDVSKILVTDTGIKLPLQRPQDAINEINDVVNVLKANNVDIVGYIHPLTKEGMTQSTSFRDFKIDCSKFDDPKVQEILARRQTTFDEFVGRQLKEALSHSMSSDDINKVTQENYMKSLYRGGTLGNQPYAIVAGKENKYFVYASPSFNTACSFAKGSVVSYKPINGHGYGFVYEYEMSPNQKFTSDYGFENGSEKYKAETLLKEGKNPVETAVYPHQNKLKSIYVYIDGNLCKIADEKGFISKEWEDFANLHPTKSMPEKMSEITRNNQLYKLFKEGKTTAEYVGKTYDFKGKSIEGYIKEQMSLDVKALNKEGYSLILKNVPQGTDLSLCNSCYFLNEVSFGSDVVLPESYTFPNNTKISGYIPRGADLSKVNSLTLTAAHIPNDINLGYVKNLTFDGQIVFGKNVILPRNVNFSEHSTISGYIPERTNLSKVKNLMLDGDITFGKNVKLPEHVRFSDYAKVSGYIPDGADLSKIQNLMFDGDIVFGEDVKLPEHVRFSDYAKVSGYIPDRTDLSKIQNLTLDGDIIFGKNVKLPENVKFVDSAKVSGYIPDGADLSKIQNLTLDGDVIFGKNVKLPKNVEYADYARVSGHIPDGFRVNTKLTGDVWIGKDCEIFRNNCIDRTNPPRIHGDVVYDSYLKGADFSKAGSLTFPQGSSITKDMRLPENGKVKFEGTVYVDSPETMQNIAKYDVKNCVFGIVDDGTIHSLPDNVNILVMKEEGDKGIITAVCKDEQSKGQLQKTCEELFSNNKDVDFAPEIKYLTQEEFAKQAGVEFTEVKPLQGVQNVAVEAETKAVTVNGEKVVTKPAENTAVHTAEKAATKSVLKTQATYAARKAKTVAKTAGKATKETLLAMNKAYDDTFDAIIKWGDKHAPQWMNKVEEATVQKAAEKFMKTKSGQAIAKQIEKKIGKKAAVSIAKKIPILCLGVGAACVYDRLKDGEYLKALGEGVSSIAYMVPGPGTLAGAGIEGSMVLDDLKLFEHGVMQADPNSHVAAESTGYDNQLKRMNEAIERQNKEAKSQKEVRAAVEKKAAEETPKAMENIKKLAPWNENSRL